MFTKKKKIMLSKMKCYKNSGLQRSFCNAFDLVLVAVIRVFGKAVSNSTKIIYIILLLQRRRINVFNPS